MGGGGHLTLMQVSLARLALNGATFQGYSVRKNIALQVTHDI